MVLVGVATWAYGGCRCLAIRTFEHQAESKKRPIPPCLGIHFTQTYNISGTTHMARSAWAWDQSTPAPKAPAGKTPSQAGTGGVCVCDSPLVGIIGTRSVYKEGCPPRGWVPAHLQPRPGVVGTQGRSAGGGGGGRQQCLPAQVLQRTLLGKFSLGWGAPPHRVPKGFQQVSKWPTMVLLVLWESQPTDHP